MFYPLFDQVSECLSSDASPSESTPLKEPPTKQHVSSLGRLCLVLFLAFSGFGLLSIIEHKWYHRALSSSTNGIMFEPRHVDTHGREAPPSYHAQATHQTNASQSRVGRRWLTRTQEFRECNPSAALPEASRKFPKGHSARPLDGPGCTSDQASVIREVLDSLEYTFKAVLPHPYHHPAHMLEALLAMDDDKLDKALDSYGSYADKAGKLGTLVKFFAWGFPVHAQELWQALGRDDAVEALTRCNIMRKCDASPLYASTVQLFPIEATSVIVATDWHVPSSRHIYGSEEPVKAMDHHTITLAHNTPVAEGKRVLDLASSGGVLGLTAASLGAEETVILQSTPRAVRFAKFNVRLNRLHARVKVFKEPLAKAAATLPKASFYLVLADHHRTHDGEDTNMHAVLNAAKRTLSENGIMVLGWKGPGCVNFSEAYNREFCGNARTGDLTGNVVCKSGNKAHPSQEGIVYGWRTDWQDRVKNKFKCGHFKTFHMRSFTSPQGAPACRFSRAGMYCRALSLR